QTRAVFAGIDLTTEYAFSAKFKHQAKLSYLRAYDQQNDDFLVLIPANRSENTLNYNFGTILKSHDTFVSLTHLWVAEQRRVPPNSDFAPPPPAYHLWTVQTGGTFKVSKSRALDWGLSVQNALNTPYRDYLNRFRYFALDQGRNVSLRLKWIF
ncbi:MAG: TonB-dependent receptor, partial [Runella slithyformis]